MIDRSRKLAAVVMLGAALAIAAEARPLHAGPGEAGRGRQSARPAGPGLAGADFVVLVWFRIDDPLATFEYQSYDVRKGEYTPAVDDWLEVMRTRYPRYEVRALPVDLDRERGETEKLKVGSVIHRELWLAAARSGIVPGAPIHLGPGPYADRNSSPRPEIGAGPPGAGRSTYLNPPATPTPFPMPYTRPHP